MYQKISKMYSKVFKCTQKYPNVPKYTNVFKSIQNILKSFNILKSIQVVFKDSKCYTLDFWTKYGNLELCVFDRQIERGKDMT